MIKSDATSKETDMAQKVADKDIIAPHPAGYGGVVVAREGQPVTPAMEALQADLEAAAADSDAKPKRASKAAKSDA